MGQLEQNLIRVIESPDYTDLEFESGECHVLSYKKSLS